MISEDLLSELTSLERLNRGLLPLGLKFAYSSTPSTASRPVEVNEVVIGHLLVETYSTSPLDPPQREALIEMAHQEVQSEASLRYELQNTLEELISKYEELTVLYESAETVATVMNLEEVSQRILEQASEILDVTHGLLMLINDSGDLLEVVAARGTREDAVGKVTVALGEGFSGKVAQTGKPILIEDLHEHPEYGRRHRADEELTSLISVPLRIRDRTIGVLNVNNKNSGDPFSSGDLKMLMALAQLAAISIQNARTYQNAITDRLTSLYNYGYFREQLDRNFADCVEKGETLCLLMFDIDHFKNFNDVNGHELGNVALVGVASLCMENSRQAGDRVPDLVARYGGEEFMVLLRGVTLTRATDVAERIRQAVEDTHFPGGENQPEGKVTVSIGVAAYPFHVKNADELVNAADEALYEAKRGGRNRVCVAQ